MNNKKLNSTLPNMVAALTGITVVAAITLAAVYMATETPINTAKENQRMDAIKHVLPTGYDKIEPPTLVQLDNNTTAEIYKAKNQNDSLVGTAVKASSNNGFNGIITVMVGFDNNGTITDYVVLEQKETPGLGTKMIDWFKPKENNRKSLVELICGFTVDSEQKNSSIVGVNPYTQQHTSAGSVTSASSVTAGSAGLVTSASSVTVVTAGSDTSVTSAGSVTADAGDAVTTATNNNLQPTSLAVTKDGGTIDAITAATISSRAFLEAVNNAFVAYAK